MYNALWDIETNNLVVECGSKLDALALVLRGIERNGPRDTDSLTLDVEDEQGDVTTIASGQNLAELARQELSGVRRVES